MKKYISVLLIIIAALSLFSYAKKGAPITSLNNEVKIMVATDIHYLAERLNDKGEYFMKMEENSDGKTTEYCKEIMEGLAESCIKEKPDALILSGDISFNGEKYSHQELAEILKSVKDAGIPVLVLPGNHDINNERAYAFSGKYIYGVENVDEEDFLEIYRDYGFKKAIFKDTASLSYVHKINNSLWVLMVDTNTKEFPGGIQKKTLEFVEDVLKEAKNRGARVISVTHQNLIKHHPDIYKGYVIWEGEKLFSLYKKYGCTLNLSGHMHIQHISENQEVTDIVTSSLMLYPIRYGIVKINENGTFYECKSVFSSDDKIMKRAWELLLKPGYTETKEGEIVDFTHWEKKV